MSDTEKKTHEHTLEEEDRVCIEPKGELCRDALKLKSVEILIGPYSSSETMRLNIQRGSMRRSVSMEDSASNIASRDTSNEAESETLWVWIKPAAFYNVIETRYHQNVSDAA